jgi:pimeloyl-ACP methyl ester carboxylesterase
MECQHEPTFLPAADRRRLERLVSGVGAAVDTAAIRLLVGMMQRAPCEAQQHTLERFTALAAVYGRPELLQEPERFFRPAPPPRVRETRLPGPFRPTLELAAPSAYEPFLPEYADCHRAWSTNLTVHARWYRCASPRATMLCLHGFGGGPFLFEERAFCVRRWLRAGVDVVLMQLPFHGRRRPREVRFTAALFPSPDVVRTNEGFGQAVHDAQALLAWLAARGAAPVGVLGYSLGGYIAALLGTLTPHLAFVAAMSPPALLSELMWRHGHLTPLRVRAEQAGLTVEHLHRLFRLHSPLARPALVPRERSFLIAGRADLLLPSDQTRALWEHWGRPSIAWFPGGHVAQVGRGQALQVFAEWLEQHGLARSEATPQRPRWVSLPLLPWRSPVPG